MLIENKSLGKIAIASDHAGYKVKEMLKQFLKQFGYDFIDIGPDNEDSVDYPDFAFKVAESVSAGGSKNGILICGTGLGMCISANKVNGIRAVTAYDRVTAEMSRRHNDANVLCLGARVLSEPSIKEIVKVWLETSFDLDNPRHQRRIQKISDYEVD